jgi:uncharacterized protein (DUF427 family)
MPIERRASRVRVEVDGVTVADSSSPTFLFEVGLPVRYYLPKSDVRMDLLTPTERSSTCHWKGRASYWSVTVDGVTHEDIVWGYEAPLHDAEEIAGLVAFYNERVDIYLDEVLVTP